MTDTKSEWLYRQSAVIPHRMDDGELRIALITSFSGRRWVIPKGVIDPGETAAGSAEREALEEAGLIGTLSDEPIGSYTYDKWGGTCHVEVFLMHVREALEDWAEADTRSREWVSVTTAARRVREPELKRLIRRVPGLLRGRS
jgi:8-oxo-dGTP pyrophosphatase MutT (NUDIX family)